MSTEKTDTGTKPTTLAAWKKARKHDNITLPSGSVVSIELPDLPEMAKAGAIPNELLEASQALTASAKSDDADQRALDVDTLVNVAEFMEFLLPKMVLEPTITPEDVKDIPTEDKEMLVAFANRARDLDAVGHHLAGLERLADWRRFRNFEPPA